MLVVLVSWFYLFATTVSEVATVVDGVERPWFRFFGGGDGGCLICGACEGVDDGGRGCGEVLL